jgi:hypothetical protein
MDRFGDLLRKRKPAAQVRCVPKSWKTDRIIAKMSLHDTIEQRPIAYALSRQIMQQAAGRVNFNDQTVNQSHCDLSHDTLDFHAGSDYVSIQHVLDVTDREWHPLLLGVRTKSISFDQKKVWKSLHLKGPTTIPLQPMFSTMGCVLTFLLMTWTILSLTIGFLKYKGALRKELEEVYVFGDDLIVPHGWGQLVIDFFNKIGFIVNADKSFYDSGVLFRETCGRETWNNTTITPIRIARGSNLGWWNSLTSSQLAEFVTRCDERDLFFTNDLLIQEIVRYEGQSSSPLYREGCTKKGEPTGKACQDWVHQVRCIGVGDEAPISCVSSYGVYRPALQSSKAGVTHRLKTFKLADGRKVRRYTRTVATHAIEVSEHTIRNFGYRRTFKVLLALKSKRRTLLFDGKDEARDNLSAHFTQLLSEPLSPENIQNARAIYWLLSTRVSAPLDEVPSPEEFEHSKKERWKHG